MRRLFPLAAVALCVLAVCPAASRTEEPTTERTDPNLPDLPGPFHAYNVTGKSEGRYHSQVSEFGFEPMVMLFLRAGASADDKTKAVKHDTEFSDPLASLLKQINNAVEKNPTARLHPFLVVESDALPEVIGVADKPDVASKEDDLRIELAAKLKDQAAALMIPHIDILLAAKDDLAKYNEKYHLDDCDFAFFLSQRDKVTASRTVKKGEKLDDALVTEIMQILADKGHATRK